MTNKDYFEGDKFHVVESSMKHPLLNPESTHYQMFDGTEAITVLEAIMSTTELMAWCRGNIYKYRLRVGNKSTDKSVSDIEKIKTYEAYYAYLKEEF